MNRHFKYKLIDLEPLQQVYMTPFWKHSGHNYHLW